MPGRGEVRLVPVPPPAGVGVVEGCGEGEVTVVALGVGVDTRGRGFSFYCGLFYLHLVAGSIYLHGSEVALHFYYFHFILYAVDGS